MYKGACCTHDLAYILYLRGYPVRLSCHTRTATVGRIIECVHKWLDNIGTVGWPLSVPGCCVAWGAARPAWGATPLGDLCARSCPLALRAGGRLSLGWSRVERPCGWSGSPSMHWVLESRTVAQEKTRPLTQTDTVRIADSPAEGADGADG